MIHSLLDYINSLILLLHLFLKLVIMWHVHMIHVGVLVWRVKYSRKKETSASSLWHPMGPPHIFIGKGMISAVFLLNIFCV